MKKCTYYRTVGPDGSEWTCVVPMDTPYDKVIMKCLEETGRKFVRAMCSFITFYDEEDL